MEFALTFSGWCLEEEKIVSICEKGDKLLADEVGKVYKGKKISKGRDATTQAYLKQLSLILTGISHPTTVSPSSYITPYTPLTTDTEEAPTALKANEAVKIQLGAQIDGFGTIVCDTIIVPDEKHKGPEIEGREADLLLATYYANELLIRLMMPPGLLASTEEEKKEASTKRAPTQSKITKMLETVVKSYDCNLVESTTSWLFERNEIEGKKKIVLAPESETAKGDGVPEQGEVWGVEMGVSLGTGKNKVLEKRPTLHRRTTITYQLKRPSSRQTLSEIVKKFGTFPFSLRQLEDERAAKVGVVECVRSNVLRQYDVISDKDMAPVARLLTTIGMFVYGSYCPSMQLMIDSHHKERYGQIKRTGPSGSFEVQNRQENYR